MDPIRRRRALSTALALLLAVESVAAVSVAASSALAARTLTASLPSASPEGQVLAEAGTASDAWAPAAPTALPTPGADESGRQDFLPPKITAQSPTPTAQPAVKAASPKAAQATPRPTAAAAPKPAATPKPTPKPTAKAAPKPTAAPKPAAVSYTGRNHVWIPSLGINDAVSLFACTRSTPPDNYVYRWGCAGTNNVYLMGHAYSVFKPLHDAYVSGRLQPGMKVYYADGAGVTHVYAVSWWKLTLPTGDVSWAWADQAVPSMTLQTCVGANSQYRLIVRLEQVG